LESKLDLKLFIRYKKKISLTEEGQLLFLHVEQAYNHLKAAEKKLENYSQGEITIGASDTLCKYFLLPYFKKFHKKYPKVKINIVNQPSRKTLQMIQEGLMDFGIVTVSDEEHFNGIKLIKLKNYQEVCIVGDELYQKTGNHLNLNDLNNYPMITLRKNTNTRKFMDDFFKSYDYVLEPEFEMVSVDLIIEMVKADLGIGFAMSDTIPEQSNLHTIDIEPNMPSRQISFAISKILPISETAKDFMNHIIEKN
jgi:DNA-binding transcriptional LysR family regulator